jgi:SAM-dependent methyltransferase
MKAVLAEKLKQLVKDNYRLIADDFNTTRQKTFWPELPKILTAVKDGSKLIDVGCGNGRLIEYLKDKRIDYLGVDNSPELLALAQGNYPDKRFVLSDILDLDNNVVGQFDYTLAIAVLHHLPGEASRLQSLEQLRKVTVPAGKIILSVWKIWPDRRYRNIILKHHFRKLVGLNHLDWGDLVFPWKNKQGQPYSDRYYHVFTLSSFKRILTKAGFKTFTVYDDQRNYWAIIDNN